jgi:hypothetical protein
MTIHSTTIRHAIHELSGRHGGQSTSPAKHASSRANIAKAREAMRIKRACKHINFTENQSGDCKCTDCGLESAPIVVENPVDVRELLMQNRYRKGVEIDEQLKRCDARPLR